jgi:polysaccharide biosynthesis transport protein
MSVQQQRTASAILPALSPLSIVRMLWKQKLTVTLAWVAVAGFVAFQAKRIPAIYKADALVLVDSQKIPDRYVSSTVVSDAQDRLATISLAILSNGQLQKIIDEFGLYRTQRKTRFTEEVLDMMRRDLTVLPERAWTGRTASFRVGFQGPDPVLVARVANRLADVFVSENSKSREVQAAGTSEFIDAQLQEAKRKLDELEAAVSQYKVKHNGELPQQEASINGMLGRLQVELEANRDAINRAQQQKVSVQDSLSVAEDAVRVMESELRPAAPAATPAPAPGPKKGSEIIEERLNEARLHYSEKHPDVVRLRNQLAQARSAEASAGAPPADGAAAKVSSVAPTPAPPSQEVAQARSRLSTLRSQLTVANQELANREVEQRRIVADIENNQRRVGALPLREQEMSQITRDYEISKANYRNLLDKKINAAMASEMEVRQKSERFTVADPARVPARPFRPRRELYYAAGCLLGLAAGLALGFGKELRSATLLGEWELPVGVPVVGRLPFIKIAPNSSSVDEDEGSRSRGRLLAIWSSAVFSAIAVMAGLYFVINRS